MMMIMMIDRQIDRQIDSTASPALCTRYQRFSGGLSMLPSATETDKQAIN